MFKYSQVIQLLKGQDHHGIIDIHVSSASDVLLLDELWLSRCCWYFYKCCCCQAGHRIHYPHGKSRV